MKRHEVGMARWGFFKTGTVVVPSGIYALGNEDHRWLEVNQSSATNIWPSGGRWNFPARLSGNALKHIRIYSTISPGRRNRQKISMPPVI